MGDLGDRDRQPSARYVERLAERLVPMLVEELGSFLAEATPLQMKSLDRALRWTVIDAAKQLRTENESAHARRPPLQGAPSGRSGEPSAEEAPLNAAEHADAGTGLHDPPVDARSSHQRGGRAGPAGAVAD